MLADRAGLRDRRRLSSRCACARGRRRRERCAVVFEASDRRGRERLRGGACGFAEQHAAGRRALRSRAAARYGAGLTRFLAARGEQVFEVGRLRGSAARAGKTTRSTRSGRRAACSPGARLALPRAGGEREALRAADGRPRRRCRRRDGQALCQLRALIVTAPEPLRAELRPLTRGAAARSAAAVRRDRRRDPELAARCSSLRSLARRIASRHRGAPSSSARSRRSRQRNSRRNCSTNPASARSSPPSCCSPGRTEAASATRPPSPASPASPRSPPHPAKRSATASTAAATANSTAPST